MKSFTICIILVLSLAISGCKASPKPSGNISAPSAAIPTLTVTSSAFQGNQAIPQKYTCDSSGLSPDLHWAGVPSGVKSLALIVDDPDAPNGTWVHWVIFNISPKLSGLPEGVPVAQTAQEIGLQGKNSSGNDGYNGPCPPKGNPHHYYFKVYALDTVLDLEPGSTKAQLEKSMTGHILAQGQLVGTYRR